MAVTIKVLGQQNPVAATLTPLYTVPALTSTVISSLVVCNRAGAGTTVRIAVQPMGAAISDEMYLYYDFAIAANDNFAAKLGITLAATDVISVYATLATVSFNLFGQESV